mgnify:CR=1 FL=1
MGTMLITTIISMFVHGRAFLLGWRDSAIEVERLKKANITARYETLKHQVNPHFLFNGLNVLSTLVYKDADLASKFIDQLAKVYRHVLDTQHKTVISLEQDLKAVESYIFLMHIRFGDTLKIEQQITPEPDELMVPLALQMLVENAIKHNEVSISFPLTIALKKTNNGYISVTNKLQHKKQLIEKSGIGLRNIRERFQQLTELPVIINESEEEFEVKVPIVKINNHL